MTVFLTFIAAIGMSFLMAYKLDKLTKDLSLEKQNND